MSYKLGDFRHLHPVSAAALVSMSVDCERAPDTLNKARLRHMLIKSADAATAPPEDLSMNHEDRSNILRLRVLDGEDLTAEEMLYECNKIREGRRSAAPTKTKSSPRGSQKPPSIESLLDILDQTMP